MKPFLTRWLCTTVAVAIATQVTGMHYDSFGALLVVSLFLGVVNALVRPLLLLLSLPFILVTLGFFILVVNGMLLWLVGSLVPGFHVEGFWQAFFAAIIVSLVSWVLSSFFRSHDGQFRVITHSSRLQPPVIKE